MDPRPPRQRYTYGAFHPLALSTIHLHVDRPEQGTLWQNTPREPSAEITDWPDVYFKTLEGVPGFGFAGEIVGVVQLPQIQAGRIEAGLSILNQQLQELLSRVQELQEALAARPVIRNGQLLDLGQADYVLARPVAIVLEEYSSGEIIARVPEFEAFATAHTESEAILSLKKQLINLYDDLAASVPGELGPLPASWKRALNHLIRKTSSAAR